MGLNKEIQDIKAILRPKEKERKRNLDYLLVRKLERHKRKETM